MALFRSTHDALKFAYNFDGTNCTNVMIGVPPHGNGRGLGGLDGAAEAGNIKRIVHSLGNDTEMIIVARFMPERIICRCGRVCCKGWYASLGWKSALRYLARTLSPVCFGGKGSEEYRMDVVAHWFRPDEMSIEEIVEKEEKLNPEKKVSRSTAYEHFDAVRKFFHSTKKRKGAEQVVFDAVDNELQRLGIVGDEE